MKNNQELLVKLGKINSKISFYNEHKRIIDMYGYVDFARVGRRKIVFDRLNNNSFFIKESELAGGRLIKATFSKCLEGEQRIPSYYNELDLTDATWARITKMEIIDQERFLKTYVLPNGNVIKGLTKGSIPFFYVVKSNDESPK